jgi:hypothetical protein
MEPRAAVKQSAELLKSANSGDHFISMKECFDADTLDAIIKNKDVCKKQMRQQCFKNAENDPFEAAENHLSKSKDGVIPTRYKQTHGFGRHCAMGEMSYKVSRERSRLLPVSIILTWISSIASLQY